MTMDSVILVNQSGFIKSVPLEDQKISNRKSTIVATAYRDLFSKYYNYDTEDEFYVDRQSNYNSLKIVFNLDDKTLNSNIQSEYELITKMSLSEIDIYKILIRSKKHV